MGVVGSKSPLERRNTVLRRSQRKSVHGVKSKAEKIAKDIKKFKGTEENVAYVELKAKIENAERDLRVHTKNLQPQIRHVHNETLKKLQECHTLLEDKLRENQEKAVAEPKKEMQAEPKQDHREEEDDDDVFVQEILDEPPPESTEKRKTVELKLVQVEPIEASPQINKRFSAMKIGVPVMPGSIMESMRRKTLMEEEKVGEIRAKIEQMEVEISQFVDRKNGKHYNQIKGQLEKYADELKSSAPADDVVSEQVKMCNNYIASCLSFLDEKAVDDDVESDDEEPDVVKSNDATAPTTNLSPRTMRTTYI
jgi:hypothetical protein